MDALRTPGRPEPAAIRVYDHVKRRVLDQRFPGGALLTEGEVADDVGVSRTPVREALLRLEAEGLLRLYPKRGALVLPVSVQEVEDVIEARELVETFTARKAWARRDTLAGELAGLLDRMRVHRAAGEVDELMAADRAFHAAIVAAAGNDILTAVYDGLRDRQMRMGIVALRAEPDRMDRSVTEHARILACLRDEDVEAFVDAVRAHVASAAASLRGLR